MAQQLSLPCPFFNASTQYISPSFTPLAGQPVTFELITNVGGCGGNDLGMDDLKVEFCNPAAPQTASITLCSNQSTVSLYNSFNPSLSNSTGTWSGSSNLTGGYLGNLILTQNSPTSVNSYSYAYNLNNDTICPLIVNTVTVNVLNPNINLAPPNLIGCNPNFVNLMASISGTPAISWSGPGIVSGANSLTCTVNQQGTYTINANYGFCQSSSTLAVASNTLNPDLSIGNPNSLSCYTSSIVLTGASTTGSVTYNWQPINVNTPTAQVINPGTYSLTVTNPVNGCSSTSLVTVSQNTLQPNISISPPGALNCVTTSIVLTGTSTTGGVTYNWQPINVNTSTTQVNNIGTYSLTVTDPGNGCSTNSIVTISQNTLQPNISISQSGVLNNCTTTSVVLTGASTTGGVTYNWQPINANTPTVQVNNTGTYSLTVVDPNNGCSSTSQVVVTSTPVFTANVSVLNHVNCFGLSTGALSINYQGAGVYPFTITNLTTNNSIGNITAFPATINNLSVGSYTLLVSDSKGCNQTLTATINQPSALNTVLNGNTHLCNGQSTSITSAVNGGTTPYSYQWLPTGGNGSNLSISPNSTTIYTLIVTDNQGCQTTASIQVVVHPIPSASIMNTGLTGCSPVCTTFSLSTTQNAGYAYNWVFTNSSTNASVTSSQYKPNLCFTVPGSYNAQITITNQEMCSVTLNHNNIIKVYPKPIADFDFDPKNPNIIESPIVNFYNQSINATSYTWHKDDQQLSTQANTSYTFDAPGNYNISLIANNGTCSDTIKKVIAVDEDLLFYAPNTFTPNHDNLNDTWYPRLSGYKLESYTLAIFDRWGELIYQTKEVYPGWDGYYKKALCKEDIYVWKVSVTDKRGKLHEFSGHITLFK
ncbi:MAG: T9SS type B sorting domain-containing protein [Sediminibacterium sp.]|nr:T9SS type B sorting domain-containing protein [Sediminibacterium sp.]